jgi:hypothetical protein
MGAWKLEYTFKNAFYIRPKAYMEEHADTCPCGQCKDKEDSTFTVRMAGLPERISSKLRFEDIYEGHIIQGKLNPKAVPGGVILKEVPWEITLK